jgi:predicted RNase H-like HicB family nuclease
MIVGQIEMSSHPSIAVIIIPYENHDPNFKFYGHVATNPNINAFGESKESVLRQIRERILTNQIETSKRNSIEVLNLNFDDLVIEQVHES